MTEPAPEHDAVEVLAAFPVALRAAGVPVTPDRTQEFLQACALLGADDLGAVYWSGRATLCGCLDDLDRYDQVFASWFTGRELRPVGHRDSVQVTSQAPLGPDHAVDGGEEADRVAIRATASSVEVLRGRDIAELSPRERAVVAGLFGGLRPRPPQRLSSRRRPSRRGEVDSRRTLRAELRNAGEPARLCRRDRSARPRRIVLLVDVSGSMSPYADSLLRFVHVVTSANRSRTEVFTVGTRLTRVTRAMRLRDGEAALTAAGQTVPDWSGGTRLGDGLHAFLDRWGQRGLARGAVVVVMSDGWERGDAALLGAQMQRLHRLAQPGDLGQPAPGQTGLRAGPVRNRGSPSACRPSGGRPQHGRVRRAPGGDRPCVTCSPR